jgi:hypothetical protein
MISWPQFEPLKCIVIKFAGECGKGTSNRGGGFASFMSAMIKAAIEAWRPMALVLDLRALKYEWGDEMSGPLRPPAFLEAPGLLLRSIFQEYPELIRSNLDELTKNPPQLPFSIVVSEKNKEGLTSLVRCEMGKAPNSLLFENIEAALMAVDRQAQQIFKKS